MVFTGRTSTTNGNVAADASSADAGSAAALKTTPFNEFAGLQFMAQKKAAITSSAEPRGKKKGSLKAGPSVIAIEGHVNSLGELRIRSTRGWLTAKTAEGTKLLEVAAGKENAGCPPRRKRTMTKALDARERHLKESFVNNTSAATGGLQGKEVMARCADAGQVVPAHEDVLMAIAQLRAAQPDLGVKKLAKQIQTDHSVWKIGCKEVRAALKSVAA